MKKNGLISVVTNDRSSFYVRNLARKKHYIYNLDELTVNQINFDFVYKMFENDINVNGPIYYGDGKMYFFEGREEKSYLTIYEVK